MVITRAIIPDYVLIILSLVFLPIGCRNRENQETLNQRGGTICAILAHPDDETIISGTLAKLSDLGLEIQVVYATSGDDGPDHTGRGLHGKSLAKVREKEATKALQTIDTSIRPIFLRYPDGHVDEYIDSLQHDLIMVLKDMRPNIIIGFGPDGITGDRDHISTGLSTDSVFEKLDNDMLLLHMAITEPLPPFYANGVPVPTENVDLCVDVSKYHRQRSQVVEAHHTQFNSKVRYSYKIIVYTMRKEKFIISANRNGDEWYDALFK